MIGRIFLAVLPFAFVASPAPAAEQPARTRFAPIEVVYSYTVDRQGKVLDCNTAIHGQINYAEDVTCDDMKDDDVLTAMMGRSLAGLSEVDVRIAFTPRSTAMPVAIPPATGRRIIAAVDMEVSPAGKVASCKVVTSTKFSGLSIDLCDMLASAGIDDFIAALDGKPRRADLLMEMLSFGG